MLIITCPCALALAIPAVQVVASGALFRAGMILNAGDAIERLAEVDTVIFDKTGTLTLPEPRVVNAAAIDPELLQGGAAGAVEPASAGRGAGARRRQRMRLIDGAVEEPGQGVRAMIDGVEARLGSAEFCGIAPLRSCPRKRNPEPDAESRSLRWSRFRGDERLDDRAHLFCLWQPRAAFVISQKLRPDAVEVVQALRALGLDLHILSGDRVAAVRRCARRSASRNGRAD